MGYIEPLYTEEKRWCSCCNREWDLWFHLVPIIRRPKVKTIAEFSIPNSGVRVILQELTYIPVKCASNKEFKEYYILKHFAVTHGSFAKNFNDAIRMFKEAIDEGIRYNEMKFFM